MQKRNPITAFFGDLDKPLLAVCILTSVFGIIEVFSATLKLKGDAIMARDARTMVLAVAVGIVGALFISMIDFSLIGKAWPVVALGCLGLMGAVLLFGVGPSARQDARTWLRIGSLFYFQPSELLKIGFVITFAVHLDILGDRIKKPLHVLLLAAHGAVPILLVARSGDMGSALVFIFIFVAMLFVGGLSAKWFILGFAGVCGAVPLAWRFVLKDLQKERVLGLFYPDRYEDVMYQQNRGMTAIRAGKLWGQGLFKGTYTQQRVVPESENDMIFTVVGEELGFIGCIAVLLLLGAVIVLIALAGRKCRSFEGKLMCCGVAAMIASQALINVGMCLKLLPVIGITLPFFSAGGSSNLCLYIGVGLVLSVYRYSSDERSTDFKLSFLKRSMDS